MLLRLRYCYTLLSSDYLVADLLSNFFFLVDFIMLPMISKISANTASDYSLCCYAVDGRACYEEIVLGVLISTVSKKPLI